MKKIVKVQLGGSLLVQFGLCVQDEGVPEAELLRRALWFYLRAHPLGDSGEARIANTNTSREVEDGSDSGPIQALPAKGQGRPDSGPKKAQIGTISEIEIPEGSIQAHERPDSGLNQAQEEDTTSSCSSLAPRPPSALPPYPSLSPQRREESQYHTEVLQLYPETRKFSTRARPRVRARERPSPEPSGSASGSASASPSVLDLPCRRARPNDPTSWPLSAAQVESWQVVFPTMDVLGEVRKAKAWLEANPSNAKTVRGMLRFLFGWLERSSNSGRFVKREGGAALASAPSGEPDAPEREWLEKRHGRESFAQWEEQLRHSLRKYPDALPGMLEDLAVIRREWEAYRDRAAEVSHAA